MSKLGVFRRYFSSLIELTLENYHSSQIQNFAFLREC